LTRRDWQMSALTRGWRLIGMDLTIMR